MALFERFGGPEVGALARRRLLEGHRDRAALADWLRLAFPLYTRAPRHPDVARRTVANPEVLHWFTRPEGEDHTFNLVPALPRVQCPTLVMGGEDDPMTPIECQADIVAALPAASGALRALRRLRPRRSSPMRPSAGMAGDPGLHCRLRCGWSTAVGPRHEGECRRHDRPTGRRGGSDPWLATADPYTGSLSRQRARLRAER